MPKKTNPLSSPSWLQPFTGVVKEALAAPARAAQAGMDLGNAAAGLANKYLPGVTGAIRSEAGKLGITPKLASQVGQGMKQGVSQAIKNAAPATSLERKGAEVAALGAYAVAPELMTEGLVPAETVSAMTESIPNLSGAGKLAANILKIAKVGAASGAANMFTTAVTGGTLREDVLSGVIGGVTGGGGAAFKAGAVPLARLMGQINSEAATVVEDAVRNNPEEIQKAQQLFKKDPFHPLAGLRDEIVNAFQSFKQTARNAWDAAAAKIDPNATVDLSKGVKKANDYLRQFGIEAVYPEQTALSSLPKEMSPAAKASVEAFQSTQGAPKGPLSIQTIPGQMPSLGPPEMKQVEGLLNQLNNSTQQPLQQAVAPNDWFASAYKAMGTNADGSASAGQKLITQLKKGIFDPIIKESLPSELQDANKLYSTYWDSNESLGSHMADMGVTSTESGKPAVTATAKKGSLKYLQSLMGDPLDDVTPAQAEEALRSIGRPDLIPTMRVSTALNKIATTSTQRYLSHRLLYGGGYALAAAGTMIGASQTNHVPLGLSALILSTLPMMLLNPERYAGTIDFVENGNGPLGKDSMSIISGALNSMAQGAGRGAYASQTQMKGNQMPTGQ
ncbi:MAG: hypothetical protein KGL39_33960 [Patescibacteria group bacterium]|nr:hypothetical protein [Patescibacteria group bacterium]